MVGSPCFSSVKIQSLFHDVSSKANQVLNPYK